MRKLIVLTPVKNEVWILPVFLRATSIWADYIIIADQNSTDGSLEIYKQFEKVILINNDSCDLDEGYRDNLMLNKAREVAGNDSILFRIDSDEIFTPDFNSKGWQELISSEPGSIWLFRCGNVGRNFCGYSIKDGTYGAFVDDGREYVYKELIHKRDMFYPTSNTPIRLLEDPILLHLQFVDWHRMESKHRWYQCFERINFPQKSCIDIYRTYHWMFDKKLFKIPFNKSWIEQYQKMGVDFNSIAFEHHYWWDSKVKEYASEYGASYFRHIDTSTPRRIKELRRKSLLVFYLNSTKYIHNKQVGLLFRVVRKIDSILKTRLHL